MEENFETEIAVCFDYSEPIDSNLRDASEDTDLPELHTNERLHDAFLNPDDAQHGTSRSGEAAACILTQPSGALVNCAQCLSMAWKAASERFPPRQVEDLEKLLQTLGEVGENGLSAEEVWVSLRSYPKRLPHSI